MKALIIVDPQYSLASVVGKPLLEHQLNVLRDEGIQEAILLLHGDISDKIKSHFGSGLRWAMEFTYVENGGLENIPASLKKAQKYLSGDFLLLRGDTYVQIPFKELFSFHQANQRVATAASILMENGNDVFSNDNKVYLLSPKIFQYIAPEMTNFEELLLQLVAQDLLSRGDFKGYFANLAKAGVLPNFKKEVLESLMLSEEHTVGDALRKITRTEVNIVAIVDGEQRLKGVITDRVIKKFLLKGGGLQDTVNRAMISNPIVANASDDQKKIESLLLSGINSLPILEQNGKIIDIAFRSEQQERVNLPIIRGKAPLRISFAGGGTDLPYFFEKYGGAVVNATIDKYCYATVIRRADRKIIIDSDLTEDIDVEVESLDNLVYDGKFNLIKAVINHMKPRFGFELYLHNDVPPGRGLGSSASAAVLLATILNQLMETHYDNYKIAEIAYKAEREELKIKGGWQDQYATLTGGFNFMEFGADKTLIYPLRIKDEVVNELKSHLLLCYVGKAHASTEVHHAQEENFYHKESEIIDNLTHIKNIAISMRDALLTSRFEMFGKLLHEAWERKRNLAQAISNQRINELYELGLKHGALGGKLLGAGNGGYLLFFYPPQRRNELKKVLERNGGAVLDFNFDFNGTVIWPVKPRL